MAGEDESKRRDDGALIDAIQGQVPRDSWLLVYAIRVVQEVTACPPRPTGSMRSASPHSGGCQGKAPRLRAHSWGRDWRGQHRRLGRCTGTSGRILREGTRRAPGAHRRCGGRSVRHASDVNNRGSFRVGHRGTRLDMG